MSIFRQLNINADGVPVALPALDDYRLKITSAGLSVTPTFYIRLDTDTTFGSLIEVTNVPFEKDVFGSKISLRSIGIPEIPLDVVATATGSTTVELDASIIELGHDGIEIWHSTTSGSGFALLEEIEETAFPYEVTGLTEATEHFFQLRTFIYDREKQVSDFTDEVSVTTGAGGDAPSAPTSLSVSEVSRTDAEITYEATWSLDGTEDSVEWWAGSNDGETWADPDVENPSDNPNSEPSGTTSVQFVATRLNDDHDGFFCVRACNTSGCSEQICDSLTVVGNLGAPSNLNVTVTDDDASLTWNDNPDADAANETAVERDSTEIDQVPFGTESYGDNNLADGSYIWRIRHRDTTTGDTSPYSDTVTETVDTSGGNGGGGGSDGDLVSGLTNFVDEDLSTFPSGAEEQQGTLTILSDNSGPKSPGSIIRGTYPACEDANINNYWFGKFGVAQGTWSSPLAEFYVDYWVKFVSSSSEAGDGWENEATGTKMWYFNFGKANQTSTGAYFHHSRAPTDMYDHVSLVTCGKSEEGQGRIFHSEMPVGVSMKYFWEGQPTRKYYSNTHGSSWFHFGSVPLDTWVRLTSYMKVNDPPAEMDGNGNVISGSANGVLMGWVNGSLRNEWNDMLFRTTTDPTGFDSMPMHCIYGGGKGYKTREDIVDYDHLRVSGTLL